MAAKLKAFWFELVDILRAIPTIFTKRWIIPTICVIAGVWTLCWLGFWQLDRRADREAYNALVYQRWASEPLSLQQDALPADLVDVEFRRIVAEGEYDFENQVVLKNQVFRQQNGVQILTPLRLEDSDNAVLVARGWAPFEEATIDTISQFDEPTDARIVGLAQESQPAEQASDIPDGPQFEWFRADIETIQQQIPYELLPFFIYQLPDGTETTAIGLIREDRHPSLQLRSPAMHTSYAIQWFAFATILGFGYLILVRVQERRRARGQTGDDRIQTISEQMRSVTRNQEELHQP